MEPSTDTHLRLATVWREVLGVDELDPGEDFFSLGGSSLGAIRLLHRIEKEFGVELSIRELYIAPTLAGCAAAIDKLVADAVPAPVQTIQRVDRG
jgi:acyl carrier protein